MLHSAPLASGGLPQAPSTTIGPCVAAQYNTTATGPYATLLMGLAVMLLTYWPCRYYLLTGLAVMLLTYLWALSLCYLLMGFAVMLLTCLLMGLVVLLLTYGTCRHVTYLCPAATSCTASCRSSGPLCYLTYGDSVMLPHLLLTTPAYSYLLPQARGAPCSATAAGLYTTLLTYESRCSTLCTSDNTH